MRDPESGDWIDQDQLTEVLARGGMASIFKAVDSVSGAAVALRALLRPLKPLSTARALEIAQQICEALAHLHAQGVVHRDLKPDNLMVTPEGRGKIGDFGIALSTGARRLTWAGLSHCLGTPDYAAPEQIRGKRGDALAHPAR